MVMPAFGAYTGGLDIFEPALSGLFPGGFETWVVGREKVRPVKPGLVAALADVRALARRRHGEALAHLAAVAPGARAAFAPLACAPLYLKAMERPDYQPFSSRIDVPQWRRQWAIWRFSRKYR